jgi:predicted ester cyclase
LSGGDIVPVFPIADRATILCVVGDILDMIAEGDKVAVRYTVEGTHEGDLFGVPPTGRRVSIESITVERVSDGKIREHWRVTDTLDMMQQLGAIPAPENAQVEDA